MIALCIVIAVLLMIALMPLGVHAGYSEKVFSLKVNAGIIELGVLPKPEGGQKKPKKKKKPAQKKDKKPLSVDKKELIKSAIPALFDILGRFKRKLTINTLTLYFKSAPEDPGDAALNYGKATAIAEAVIPFLENSFKIKKKDIRAFVSFDGEGNDFYCDVKLTLRIWHIFYIIFGLYPVLKVFLKKPDLRKVEEHGQASGK